MCRGRTAQEATEDILNEQLPALMKLQKDGQLHVDSIDVFCEKGVFDVEQSRAILQAGRRAGLRLNFHAEELSFLGGAEVPIHSLCFHEYSIIKSIHFLTNLSFVLLIT